MLDVFRVSTSRPVLPFPSACGDLDFLMLKFALVQAMYPPMVHMFLCLLLILEPQPLQEMKW